MPRKPNPQPHLADHKLYGRGEILSVRELDSGGGVFVADVRFADGTRTIRLLAEYWRSSILSLIPKTKKRASATRKSPPSNKRDKDLPAQVGAA